MSDKQFDDIIRSKLNDFETQDQVGGWSDLKQKMQAADTGFDEKVRETVNQFTTPVPEQGWSQLYGQYQRQKYLRNQVIAIKSGELLILLLCFFTFFNYTNIFETTDKKNSNLLAANQTTEVEYKDGHIVSETNPTSVREESNSKRIASANSTATERIVATTRRQDQTNDHKNHNHNIVEQTPTPMDAVSSANGVNSDINQNDYVSVAESQSTHESGIVDAGKGINVGDSGSDLTSAVETNQQVSQRHNSLNVPAQLGHLSLLTPIGVSILLTDRVLPEIIMTPQTFKEEWSKSWQVFTSINNYTILSPRDEIYNVDEQVLYTPGFSVSAMYGISKKGFDILSGVSYSRIGYEPYPVQEKYQSEEGINIISLTRIQYDIISVPLTFRKHIVKTDDWSFFTGIGLQAGLVVHEYYGIDDRLDVPIPRPESARGDAKYRSRLSEKEFTRAVFNGGKFSENVFLHGTVHGGVERKLSSRSSLFLSFEYAHHLLSPLGPNNDKMNVFSFGSGVRFNLN